MDGFPLPHLYRRNTTYSGWIVSETLNEGRVNRSNRLNSSFQMGSLSRTFCTNCAYYRLGRRIKICSMSPSMIDRPLSENDDFIAPNWILCRVIVSERFFLALSCLSAGSFGISLAAAMRYFSAFVIVERAIFNCP